MNITPLGSNKTELKLNNGIIIFFSYKTPVACFIPAEGHYKTSTKWSRTTSKHITMWLDGVEAEEKEQSFFDNLIK